MSKVSKKIGSRGWAGIRPHAFQTRPNTCFPSLCSFQLCPSTHPMGWSGGWRTELTEQSAPTSSQCPGHRWLFQVPNTPVPKAVQPSPWERWDRPVASRWANPRATAGALGGLVCCPAKPLSAHCSHSLCDTDLRVPLWPGGLGCPGPDLSQGPVCGQCAVLPTGPRG